MKTFDDEEVRMPEVSVPRWADINKDVVLEYLTKEASDYDLERAFFKLGAPTSRKGWKELPGYVKFKIQVWNAVMRWFSSIKFHSAIQKGEDARVEENTTKPAYTIQDGLLTPTVTLETIHKDLQEISRKLDDI